MEELFRATMFKDKLKQLRLERNLTQADVAKSIGVSPATIGNYEQGTREPRNNEMWQKLADFFDVSVDDLMDKQSIIEKRIVKHQNDIEINHILQENAKLKKENEILKQKLQSIMIIVCR